MSDFFNLHHGLISFFYLVGNLLGFFLQNFKSLDELVVLKNVSLGFCELVEQSVFEQSQLDPEFTLQFDNVVPLFVDFRPLLLQKDVEALVLKTRGSHREVNKGHSRAQVRGKRRVGISGYHVELEVLRVVNLLVSYSDQDSAADFLHLLVQNAI